MTTTEGEETSMILAIETATDICSVAFQNPEGEIFEKRIKGRSVHSDHLFLFIEELREQHDFKVQDLDAVLVSNGPGSYTGLRIAASAVKGLLFGLDVGLYACGTLSAFAAGVEEEGVIHAIIDARRTHLYHRAFARTGGRLKALGDARVREIQEVEREINAGDHVTGTGIGRLSTPVIQRIEKHGAEKISAANLIHLFTGSGSSYFTRTEPEELDPVYLSNNQVNNAKL